MLAQGIAFVLLRHRSLYHAQVATKRDSPAHREDLIFDALTGLRVADVMVKDRPYEKVRGPDAGADRRRKGCGGTPWQDVFPVLDADGKLVGIVLSEVLRTMAANPDIGDLAIAHDLMVPPVSVTLTDDLQQALEVILEYGLRRDRRDGLRTGVIVGFLDEAEIHARLPRLDGEQTRVRRGYSAPGSVRSPCTHSQGLKEPPSWCTLALRLGIGPE